MFNSLNSFTKGSNFADIFVRVLDSALVRFSATKQQIQRRQSPLHFSIDKKADNFLVDFLLWLLLPIEEEWSQKPRQIVVVAFWGKMAADLDCVADELIKAGWASNTVYVLVNAVVLHCLVAQW